ncbi:hypothetical protein TNCV_1626861 [Trichonephila clavipes]|nr:hypothetical protein TNCV_1626861 [Trichonephila clavipes]
MPNFFPRERHMSPDIAKWSFEFLILPRAPKPGYVKSLVYADKPQTLDHLEDNIRRVIADIRPQMLEKVIENWTSRLDYIRASRGSPMPEIIFKMYSVEEKPMRYLNDQPMRCSLLWQRDPVNRSRGDDLPIILSDAEERDEEEEKVIINEVVFLVESCDF